jgi:predicted kinase
MQTIYLVAGKTGAGKTYYAKQLADTEKALLLVLDEWMETLFVPDMDSSKGPDYKWMLERIARAESVMWDVAASVLHAGKSVVMEVSMSSKAQRSQQAERAKNSGGKLQIVFVDAPQEVRRQRVATRNHRSDNALSYQVTPEMFNFVEELYEDLDVTELTDVLVVNNL